jgi:hypothetical protein
MIAPGPVAGGPLAGQKPGRRQVQPDQDRQPPGRAPRLRLRRPQRVPRPPHPGPRTGVRPCAVIPDNCFFPATASETPELDSNAPSLS